MARRAARRARDAESAVPDRDKFPQFEEYLRISMRKESELFFGNIEKGELIVNSRRDGQGNIGHPFQAEEVAWFMKMLQKSAPKMTAEEARGIEAWLKNQKR